MLLRDEARQRGCDRCKLGADSCEHWLGSGCGGYCSRMVCDASRKSVRACPVKRCAQSTPIRSRPCKVAVSGRDGDAVTVAVWANADDAVQHVGEGAVAAVLGQPFGASNGGDAVVAVGLEACELVKASCVALSRGRVLIPRSS